MPGLRHRKSIAPKALHCRTALSNWPHVPPGLPRRFSIRQTASCQWSGCGTSPARTGRHHRPSYRPAITIDLLETKRLDIAPHRKPKLIHIVVCEMFRRFGVRRHSDRFPFKKGTVGTTLIYGAGHQKSRSTSSESIIFSEALKIYYLYSASRLLSYSEPRLSQSPLYEATVDEHRLPGRFFQESKSLLTSSNVIGR